MNKADLLELEDWKQRASTEIEQSLSGNRQKLNIIEEEFVLVKKMLLEYCQ